VSNHSNTFGYRPVRHLPVVLRYLHQGRHRAQSSPVPRVLVAVAALAVWCLPVRACPAAPAVSYGTGTVRGYRSLRNAL
jgi:hypothetical protein